jgi:hypothetical protein
MPPIDLADEVDALVKREEEGVGVQQDYRPAGTPRQLTAFGR